MFYGRDFMALAGTFALFLVLGAKGQSSSGPISVPFGQIIYDNSSTGGTNFFPIAFEYGDEIFFKDPPTPEDTWILTGFLVEYFGDFTPQGDETGRLRLYLNDGPGMFPTPGTLIYDSQEFPIEAGFQVKVVSGLNIPVPDHLTWTVEFGGIRGVKGDQAGVLLRPEPAVGSSYLDFWIRGVNGWATLLINPAKPNFPADPVTNPDPVENFGSRFIGLPSTTSALPRLDISRQSGSITIRWNGSARLQVSDTVGGDYSDVTGAVSPYTVETDGDPGSMKFWRLATAASPRPSALTIRQADSNLVIEWAGNGRLQVSDTVSGPYANVENATSPHTVDTTGASPATRFWRLAN